VTAELRPLRADDERVWVASPTDGDVPAYERAIVQSRARVAAWNPVDPHALAARLETQSPDHRTFLIHARNPVGDHALVGMVNVTGVVRGRLLSGNLGYGAFDPYAGRGLVREGLRLVVDLAFAPAPDGMGLHRVEATVQPGNIRSGAVLRRLGFVHEGFSPRYLYLADATHAGSRWWSTASPGPARRPWPGPWLRSSACRCCRRTWSRNPSLSSSPQLSSISWPRVGRWSGRRRRARYGRCSPTHPSAVSWTAGSGRTTGRT